MTKQPPLSSQKVIAYLTKRPDFLAANKPEIKELVKKLRLTHPTSGKEISLLMYQNRLWREEAEELKKIYDDSADLIFYERELQNIIYRAFLMLGKAKSLSQFCRSLDATLGSEFRVNAKRLVFFSKAPLLPYYQTKSLARAPKSVQGILSRQHPTIIQNHKEISAYFFDGEAADLTSYLLLPLRTRRKAFAILCLGDKNLHRFDPEMPILLMSFFADLIARELEKHLLAHKGTAAALGRKKNPTA